MKDLIGREIKAGQYIAFATLSAGNAPAGVRLVKDTAAKPCAVCQMMLDESFPEINVFYTGEMNEQANSVLHQSERFLY